MDSLFAETRRGLPFGSRHPDVESATSGTHGLLIAEGNSRRVLTRDSHSLYRQSVHEGLTPGCETGRGRGVSRARR